MTLFSKLSAATAFAVFAIAPAAAQPETTPEEGIGSRITVVGAMGQPDTAESDQGIGSRITVIGAMKDPAAAETPARPEDETVPELPIVYEDDDQG